MGAPASSSFRCRSSRRSAAASSTSLRASTSTSSTRCAIRTKPTWMFGFEGRFSLSEPMHACNAGPPPGQVQCANPADVEPQRRPDGNPDATATSTPRRRVCRPQRRAHAGVSRGTTGLELHTILSKRIKYIEPYAGFRTLFEFPNSESDFGASDLKGSLVNHPPLQGWLTSGIRSSRGSTASSSSASPSMRAFRRFVPLGGARLLRALRRARFFRGGLAAPRRAIAGVPPEHRSDPTGEHVSRSIRHRSGSTSPASPTWRSIATVPGLGVG